MRATDDAPSTRRTPGWAIVLEQELRDLWIGGRGLALSFAFGTIISVIAYVTASSDALNFLEHREAVNLTLQVAIAIGTLLALLAAADAISGERERGTLETLLLTPISRLQLTLGKLLAALSLWLAAFLITVPYLWFLGRGVGVVGHAVLAGFVVGTLLAIFLASLGIAFSIVVGSNRVSLALSLLLLLALFAPTQLPSSAQKGWAGELLLRVNPVTAGESYVGKVVVDGHSLRDDVSWLISPLVGAIFFAVGAGGLGAHRLRLRGSASA